MKKNRSGLLALILAALIFVLFPDCIFISIHKYDIETDKPLQESVFDEKLLNIKL